MSESRECAFDDCRVPVRGEILMCRDHWLMVDESTRRRIWFEWDACRRPTKTYVRLVMAAKQQIRSRLGQTEGASA